MEASYAIASLQHPFDGEHGQTQASSVISIKWSRKRKRHEVAVGVDGEGLNIYNVQSHSIVASYALPPQSYLCCPPCSVYGRQSQSTAAKRTTYVVVKDGRKSSKRRLLTFTEDVKKRSEQNEQFTGPEKRECNLHNGDIAGVEVVPSTSDEQHSVLVNYANGGAELISSDLSRRQWQDPPTTAAQDEYVVEHAEVLDVQGARKGILKGREDIVALLEQDATPLRSTKLLCRLVRSKGKRLVELHALHDRIQTSLQASKTPLQLLTSYELPLIATHSHSSAYYQLHAESGTLYQLLDDTLRVFDLSGTIPKVAPELGGKSDRILSFSRVSSNLVMAFSHRTAMLFETSYGSLRGSISFPAIKSASKGKKRKPDVSGGPKTLHAISEFTDLGLVAVLGEDELIAFRVTDTLRQSRGPKSSGTLLSSIVASGSIQPTLENTIDKAKTKAWDAWKLHVDSLIGDSDLEGLERLVAHDPKLGRQRERRKRRRGAEEETIVNGDVDVYDKLWPLPEPFDPRNVDRRKALYILGIVFGYDGETNRLFIRLESLKLLEWLALIGLLSTSKAEMALGANQIDLEPLNLALKPGNIMSAIRGIDGDFQIMRDVLALPVHWEIAEVIQALRLVIQSFDTPPTEDRMLALPAPPQANGETDMTNGEIDIDLEYESKAVENELDLAMNTLSTGLEVRSDTVQIITRRLHAFPAASVTTTMREMMSHSEIIFFIHILRIELADGGWTSQYVDVGDSETQDGLVSTIGISEERGQPSNQAIRAIGNLLNCAVDAIGTSGWLIGQSGSMNGADGLIDTLRAEISAGLEGCYEASTLDTLLTELQRCSAYAEKANVRPGTDITRQDNEANMEKSLLPLGSRDGHHSLAGRNSKSSSKKTKMALGREKSKRVGKYSFERIRI